MLQDNNSKRSSADEKKSDWSTVFRLPSDKIYSDVSFTYDNYVNQMIGRMDVSDFRIMYTTVMGAVYTHYRKSGDSLQQPSGHYIRNFFSAGGVLKFQSDMYGIETGLHYQMLATFLRRCSDIVFEFAKCDEEDEAKIQIGRAEAVELVQLHASSLMVVMTLLKKNFDPILQKKIDSCSYKTGNLYAYCDYKKFIQTYFGYASKVPKKLQESPAPSSPVQVKKEGEGEGVAMARAGSPLSPPGKG